MRLVTSLFAVALVSAFVTGCSADTEADTDSEGAAVSNSCKSAKDGKATFDRDIAAALDQINASYDRALTKYNADIASSLATYNQDIAQAKAEVDAKLATATGAERTAAVDAYYAKVGEDGPLVRGYHARNAATKTAYEMATNAAVDAYDYATDNATHTYNTTVCGRSDNRPPPPPLCPGPPPPPPPPSAPATAA